MNPVLEEIITNGITESVTGEKKKVVGQISINEGNLIRRMIAECGAQTSVEVGLAFGTSALFICESLIRSEKTKHYVIDPYQMYEESYGGIGLNNLRRAGFSDIVEFIDKPSHLALAELAERNVTVDFAFIDGWHTFDHVLVDFFLADKILRTGGVMILDDTDWPAIEKAASFIIRNRNYKFIAGTPQRSYTGLKDNGRNENMLSKVRNTFRKTGDDASAKYGAMAFRKESDDTRSWNHFTDF